MRLTCVLSGVGLLAALLLSGAADAASQNWAQSYFGAGHTGHNPNERTLSSSNVAQLQLKWDQSLTGAVVAYALDKGVIYAQTQVAADKQRHLVALNADTGAALWDVGTGNDQRSDSDNRTIASNSKLVFAPCGGPSNSSGICAYRKGDGQQAWQYIDTDAQYGMGTVISTPVYSGGTVYFASNRPSFSGTILQDMVALNAASGAVRWLNNLVPYASHAIIDDNPVAVGDGLVYVGYKCDTDKIANCPQNAFFGVVALSTAGGTPAWYHYFGSTVMGLSVTKSTLFANVNCFHCGDATGIHQAALDASTGAQLWDVQLNGTGGGVSAEIPVTDGKLVYANGFDGLHAMIPATGTQKWFGDAGAAYGNTGMSVANGVIYTWGAQDGGGYPFIAYNARNGHLLWSTQLQIVTLRTAPIVADGFLYIDNAYCGNICAFALPQGGR